MKETPALRGFDFWWGLPWFLQGWVFFWLVDFFLVVVVGLVFLCFTGVWVTISQFRNKFYSYFLYFMLSSLYQIRGAILIWCKSQLGVRLWLHLGNLAFVYIKHLGVHTEWIWHEVVNTNCEKGGSVHELYLI